MNLPAIKWTDAQRAGIEAVGRSLLVSAAAGSGKTAVLAERCASLVCDAEKPCDIDRLLVVTFTEPAAAEMKTRIQSALRKRLAEKPSQRLARQVGLAEHAHVSTVHGFCYGLLKQNFTLAGIDPEFRVLDPDEGPLMRQEIAADLFHRRYEEDETGDFQRLIDAYGDGKDEALIRQVVWIHELLASLIDPQGWIEQSVSSLREAADKPLEQSKLGKLLIGQIDGALSDLVRRCDDAVRTLRAMGPEFGAYVEYLGGLSPFFLHWKEVLKDDGLDMLIGEVGDFRQNMPRIPAIGGKVAGKELAKSLVDSVKNAIRENPLADLLSSGSGQWRDGLRRVWPHASALLSLVTDFSAEYAAAKAGQRALDFADLERMSLNILREGESSPSRPSALARSLHEQFRHVLVDEYQDINPIQDAILRLVSRECVSERDGNLFCVGDVKQSIFRFRLAEPGRFLERHKRFSAASDERMGKVIHLRENFRSRRPLLEAINGVFERLMTSEAAEIEYDQSHRLAAGRSFPEAGNVLSFSGSPIELHLLPREVGEAEGLAPMPKSEQLDRVDYEAILVARRIRELLGQEGSPPVNVCKRNGAGEDKLLPIELSDMVILLRAMRHKADRYAEVLRAHGIAVHNEAGGQLLEATEVRDVLCLLRILDNQRQDIPLAAVLRSPLSGLAEADDALARIRAAYLNEAEPVAFHEAVRRYAAEKDDELSAYLKDFLELLREWRDQTNKRPVAELIWGIYEETGYLAFCGGLEDGEQRVANLLELHERAGQFGGFMRQGLYRFLKFVESLEEDGGVARRPAAGKTDQAVRIMSIHRSKGLEFPVVFLPDLGKEINVSDAHGSILVDRQMGLGMAVVDEQRLIRYPSLASVLVGQNLYRQTMAEELRLLYVAMTRAKEHLILVATCGEADRGKWESQWMEHKGPLPADEVRAAQRVIDWVGPVAAMTQDAVAPIFSVHEHPVSEVRTWRNPRHNRAALSERQRRMIRLEPLSASPPENEDSRKLIARFQTKYRFEAFTRARAAASVTTLAKGDGEKIEVGRVLERKLDLPRFYQREAIPKATDIGNATHAVLQYFDFAVSPTRGEIDRQIAQLVDRKLLARDYAGMVDRGAVLWFLESELGVLVRKYHAELIREAPFALMRAAVDCPASEDPLDQMMVRGRIDLLVPTAAGLSIVDYKTDKVSGPELEQRVESYRRQMEMYAEALREVAKREVASVHLVFLTPRLFVKL